MVGVETPDIDSLRRQMGDILRAYVDPDPDIRYTEIESPITANKRIGVLAIAPSGRRPYVIREGVGDKKGEGNRKSRILEGQILMRRGSRVRGASRTEILAMVEEDLGVTYKEDFEQCQQTVRELNKEMRRMEKEISELDDEKGELDQERTRWFRLARAIYRRLKDVDEDEIRELFHVYGQEGYYKQWTMEET